MISARNDGFKPCRRNIIVPQIPGRTMQTASCHRGGQSRASHHTTAATGTSRQASCHVGRHHKASSRQPRAKYSRVRHNP